MTCPKQEYFNNLFFVISPLVNGRATFTPLYNWGDNNSSRLTLEMFKFYLPYGTDDRWKVSNGPLAACSPDFLRGANGETYQAADWFWTYPIGLCAHVLQLVLIHRLDPDIFIWYRDSLLFLPIGWGINAQEITVITLGAILFYDILS